MVGEQDGKAGWVKRTVGSLPQVQNTEGSVRLLMGASRAGGSGRRRSGPPGAGSRLETSRGLRRKQMQVQAGLVETAIVVALSAAAIVSTSVLAVDCRGPAERGHGSVLAFAGRAAGFTNPAGLAPARAARCPIQAPSLAPRCISPSFSGPLRRGGRVTELRISLTISGDDDEEIKKDYQLADRDGSRIFLSGLAPSVDENRLILALAPFEGVVEVKLAKPGLGFALFMDPASADVALESMKKAKLGGKPVTARRARSFYIHQQQQATQGAFLHEQGLFPSQFDLRRRSEAVNRPTGAVSLDMRRASLSNAPRAMAPETGQRDLGSTNLEAYQDGDEEDSEDSYTESINEALSNVDRIRKQAIQDVMKQEDVRKVRRRRRNEQGELEDLPDSAPGAEDDQVPTLGDKETANRVSQMVKERMEQIQRIEQLKRVSGDLANIKITSKKQVYRERQNSKRAADDDESEASSHDDDIEDEERGENAKLSPSAPSTTAPTIRRNAAAQRAYDILNADRSRNSAARGGVRGAHGGSSMWDDEDDDENEGTGSVMGRGRMYADDQEDAGDEEEEDDLWADYDREIDDELEEEWDPKKDDGTTASQVEHGSSDFWAEGEREDWNRWKETQDDELEELYVDDADDLLGRQDRRGRTSRIKGSGNEPLAPAGTSAGDLAKFTGVRGAGRKGEHAQVQAADLAPSHSGGLSASRQGSDGGGGKGTPLDTDLFAMLNMEDDEFDSLFGPSEDVKNPFGDEMKDDIIFSDRGRGLSSGVGVSRPSAVGIESDAYWDTNDQEGVSGEIAAGSEEVDLGGMLKGLLGGSGLETLGQNWDEDEDWDEADDELPGEEDLGGMAETDVSDALDEDDEDAFLAQFDALDERSNDSSDEEPILDKLRRRNPAGAMDVDLPPPASRSTPAVNAVATGPAAVKAGKNSQQTAPRDLDAIFGPRPSQPQDVTPPSVVPDPAPVVAGAGLEEGKEEGDEIDVASKFGPAQYNSKAAEERRLLEAAADKLLASTENGGGDSEKEYSELLGRAGVGAKLNRRLGGNLQADPEPTDAQPEIGNEDVAVSDADYFLEAAMFGFNTLAEGGDAAVYDSLIDAIDGVDEDGAEAQDSQLGWPSPDGEDEGTSIDPWPSSLDSEPVSRADQAAVLDVTEAFRQGVSGGLKEDGSNMAQQDVFAAAFQAKALNDNPKKSDLFDRDPHLEQLALDAQTKKLSDSDAASAAPGSGLPGRKMPDTEKVRAMMNRVSMPGPQQPERAAPGRHAQAGVDPMQEAMLRAQERAKMTEPIPVAEDGSLSISNDDDDDEDDQMEADAASSLLTSPVPVDLMQSLGLLGNSPQKGLLSTMAGSSPGREADTLRAKEGADNAPSNMLPITGGTPAGAAGAVMTYNALVSVLQQRVDSKYESLLSTIDAQAQAARREMILAQLTPEAIALNCLTDVLEKKIEPMLDTQTRMGARLRDIELDWSYKERLWEVQERIKNDFKFRMLFVPGYVRGAWEQKKQSIRAGSVDVRAVTLQRRRRRAKAAQGEEATVGYAAQVDELDYDWGEAQENQEDEASRVKASTAWEDLKARARLQRSGAGADATVQQTQTSRAIASQTASGGEGAGDEEDETWFSGSSVSEMLDEAVVSSGDQHGENAGAGLPLSERASLAEIRRFIREHQLTEKVKTSGTGRTKKVIYAELAALWIKQ